MIIKKIAPKVREFNVTMDQYEKDLIVKLARFYIKQQGNIVGSSGKNTLGAESLLDDLLAEVIE